MHNILHELKFWPDGTTDYKVNCLLASQTVEFDLILFKLASCKDMHKILDAFELWPDWTT